MQKKQILFRADGNSKTGLGHLYRIFALIEMLKVHYDCTLITRADSELVIIPKTYNYKVMPSKIDVSNEGKWLSEHFKTTEVIIADGYDFDSIYHQQLKKHGFKLIYIDDLTTTKMYADVVVNHSLVVKPENFTAEPYTKFALGPKYAMLRPKFIEISKERKEISTIENVFVSFGGADFFDLTSKSVKALIDIDSIKEIHVLIGAAYKHKEIFTLENGNNQIIIHKNLPETEVLEVMKNLTKNNIFVYLY